MNKVLLVVTLGISAVFSANASLINFDDLNVSDYSTPLSIYEGFTWNNFYVASSTDAISNPIQAAVSPNNFIYNYTSQGGNPSITRSASFDFISGYLTASRNDGTITVYGYLNNTLLYTKTIEINQSGPTQISFDFTGVNEVLFDATGTGGVAMDNVKIMPATAVPEPDTYLSALGLLGMFFLLFKKRK